MELNRCSSINEDFSWLSLDNQADYHSYLDIWRKDPYRRPHDHPDFLQFMKPSNYNPAVVLYEFRVEGVNTKIAYPFLWCDLTLLPPFTDVSRPMRHLVSPYGYGGALYYGDPQYRDAASVHFEERFSLEMRQRSFVSEFVREDIFAHRLARRSAGEAIEQQPNVVVRLGREAEDIWKTYKPKVRKNVNRANENGLRIEFDHTGERLDDFIKIYYETMERTEASNSFCIPRDRFEALGSSLGKDGGLVYVHAYDGNDMVSTELLLLAHETIYSFLGGTLTSAFEKRPNDLLKHEVIRWGGQNFFKWYVLGGGVSSGDGIFKYKEAFDPQSIFPFYVRRVIHDQVSYGLLTEKRAKYEKEKGKDWQPKPDFFPVFLS